MNEYKHIKDFRGSLFEPVILAGCKVVGRQHKMSPVDCRCSDCGRTAESIIYDGIQDIEYFQDIQSGERIKIK